MPQVPNLKYGLARFRHVQRNETGILEVQKGLQPVLMGTTKLMVLEYVFLG